MYCEVQYNYIAGQGIGCSEFRSGYKTALSASSTLRMFYEWLKLSWLSLSKRNPIPKGEAHKT